MQTNDVVLSQQHNSKRQIVAMMRKDIITKWRHDKSIIVEFVLPFVFGFLLKYASKAFKCDESMFEDQSPKRLLMEAADTAPMTSLRMLESVTNTNEIKCTPETIDQLKLIQSIMMPFMMAFYAPQLSAITARFIVQNLVIEKQFKIRESLRLMSLSSHNYLMSYFYLNGFFALLQGLIIGSFVYGSEDLFLVDVTSRSIQMFLVIILLLLAQVPFAMSMSTVFSDHRLAVNVAALAVVMLSLIFIQFAQAEGDARYFMYAFFGFPVIPACVILGKLVTIEEWESFSFFKLSYFSAEAAWVALVISVPLWIGIYYYLEKVMPSTYGIRQPWCFCLKKKRSVMTPEANQVDAEGGFHRLNNSQEPDPSEGFYCPTDPIKVQGLSKSFGSFEAVKQLRFSIAEDKVFTILGHNGAGKTTLIYMLTGVLNPTSGDAIIYDKSVKGEIEDIQRNLGLCQQFDCLFDKMTVLEHLRLVCELKNVPESEMEAIIKETLDVVMLTEAKDKLACELSGGMKRKLSLGMAIVTRPQVLILDEPTSGLDVKSRRQIWDLIREIKKGRSIIMSSQHLEEADELADRIMIMTKGSILKIDTPEAIKNQYGVGYKLLIEKRDENLKDEEFKKIEDERLDSIILNEEKKIVKNQDSSEKMLIYQVPFKEEAHLKDLLKTLEASDFASKLVIDIEVNSLEDAYINIAKDEEEKHWTQKGQHPSDLEVDVDPEDVKRYRAIEPSSTFSRQAGAIFRRRIKEFYLQPMQWFLLFLPFLAITINVIILSTVSGFGGDGADFKDVFYAMVYPLIIIFNYMQISPFFCIASTTDRILHLRYLLNFSGIRPTAYFVGMMGAELLLNLVPCILILAFIFILGIEVIWKHGGEIFLALYLFGIPFIPISHMVGFILKTQEALYKFQPLPIMLLFMLSYGLNVTKLVPDEVLRIFSPFQTLNDIIKEALAGEIDSTLTTTSWERVWPIYFFYFLQGAVFFSIVVSIDTMLVNWFKKADGNSDLEVEKRTLLEQNDDIKHHGDQARKVWDDPRASEDYRIQALNLRKVFKGKKDKKAIAAVANNSFAIKDGEIFGLLGPNGAGKSTTFNMLTMDLRRTSGDAKIMGHHLNDLNIIQEGAKMGLCPQSNTIWDFLDVDQSLQFIADIKGIAYSDIEFVAHFLKKTLDLDDYSKTKASDLSGGNKRKLVCAMSLVAHPTVEFLDEPSTGVDPVSRRSLFKMLQQLKKSSMILTTHRMDEAESLCDKIVIQVNGSFVCYGRASDLKNAYSHGYTAMIKHTCSIEELKKELEAFETLRTFQVHDTTLTDEFDGDKGVFSSSLQMSKETKVGSLGGLSRIFEDFLGLKAKNTILDFKLARSSLEQVFLQFASKQHIEEEEA